MKHFLFMSVIFICLSAHATLAIIMRDPLSNDYGVGMISSGELFGLHTPAENNGRVIKGVGAFAAGGTNQKGSCTFPVAADGFSKNKSADEILADERAR